MATRDPLEQHPYSDGTLELQNGVLFLLLSGLFFVDLIPEDTPANYAVSIGWILLVVGFTVFQNRILSAIRQRVAYSRMGNAGAIATPPRQWRTDLLILVVGLVVLSVLVAVVRAFDAPGTSRSTVFGRFKEWLAAVLGVASGAAMLRDGMRRHLRRLVVAGVISIALGLGAWLTTGLHNHAFPLYLAGMGLTLLVTGGIALRRLMRTPPSPS